MASFQKSHPGNVPGPLFTDTTCIDCGTCYHLAPFLFHENEADDKSVVIKQPSGEEEWLSAKQSILSCPTNSIGVKEAPEIFKELDPGLPLLITENVFYLGYTSRDSFGATSYLIKREEGNIMVDSPKFHPWLVKEIEKLGGVKLMVLSHQDDVADHAKFHEHFKCDRLIHFDDVNKDTASCEIIIKGQDSISFFNDFKIIMTPGHTKGHINFLYKDKFLFTGDHIFVEQENRTLRASRGVNWYSWNEQIKSVEKLVSETFEWILPGHGGWGQFSKEEAREKMRELLAKMKETK
jgi:glyoxylase-like metal-dependent hydrolase (beta-lactamase superfamily II)/ferredoxin